MSNSRGRKPYGCDDFLGKAPSRREAIRAGGLALSGLGLPELFRGRARAEATENLDKGFGRAKSCILIFMWGGPSQLDTWDPKPDAPSQVRGEFKAIPTSTPGIFISEHFPKLAKQTHRLAIVRSLTHGDPAHLSSAHRVLTGHLAPKINSDADGPSPKDSPHLGSIVSKLFPRRGAMPAAVTMPWTVAHPAAPGGRAPGQHAGWLGKAHDPFAIEGNPNSPNFRVEGLELPGEVTPERFVARRDLLSGLTDSPLAGAGARSWNGFQETALDALSSAEARGAFRVDLEPEAARDRYGRHIHGQCLLLARRLVERGVPLVTVNWYNDGQNFWDTHSDNFKHLKNRLMPPADQGFSALLDDLDSRGMLDETLVVWVGEFGRTPKTTQGGAGREHWPRCYSGVLAGGGVRGGSTFGASDRWASYPAADPVSPDDLGATILHALGIAPATEILDAVQRPVRINLGAPMTRLFA